MLYVFTLFFGFVLCAKSDELYLTSVPSSITIQQDEVSHLQPTDVANFVNFLLGFSAHRSDASYGVRKVDIFDRPEGNLFINVFLPEGIKFSPPKYEAQYVLDNTNNDHLSFLTTSFEIDRLYGKQSLLLDYELSNQDFLVESTQSAITQGLPTSHAEMESRLQQSGSVTDGQTFKCLAPQDDLFFFGELQMLSDVAAKLTLNSELSSDGATDFIYISVTSLTKLADVYGAESCQVQEATEIFNNFLPFFIASLDNTYNGKLLCEVRTCVPNKEKVFSRQRRAVTDTINTNTTTMNVTGELNDPDYAMVINMGVWTTVVFALATLAAAYSLWFMDPGRDNIVYRMTMTRMKSD